MTTMNTSRSQRGIALTIWTCLASVLLPLLCSGQVSERLTPAEIAERAASSVVVLLNIDETGRQASLGSGFIVAPSVIMTNYHVIRGASQVRVKLGEAEAIFAKGVIAYSPQQDVAVIAASTPENIVPLPLADSSLVRVGDHVVSMGAPLGLERTLSDGLVSGIRAFDGVRRFQISAPISHGSSGGPIFNDYGQVIGLAVSIMEKGELLNFAVPTKEAVEALHAVGLMSFSDVLSETLVESRYTDMITVPAGRRVPFTIRVPQQGGTLSGSFAVAGGAGNDVVVSVIGPGQQLVLQPTLAKVTGTLKLHLAGGVYSLIFDNTRSIVSAKSINPNLTLRYYR